MITITLFKWVRDYVGKYSFIDRTEFKGGIFYLYYTNDGKTYYKKIPYRTNKNQFINVIEKIKSEINYYEKRAITTKRINKEIEDSKPLIFANK